MTLGSEIFEKVKELWALGMTAGQICEYFNKAFTRNQVLGKLYREGLLGFRNPQPRKPRKPVAAYRRRRPKVRSDGLPFAKPIPLPPAPDAAQRSFNGEPCGIMELTMHTCRWPIGDPQDDGFGYCGAYVGKGPYCPLHKQIAYVPPLYRIR